MATIYKTNGEVIETTPKNGKDFSLEEMQAIVGGYIEIVYLDNGQIMVVNEEGKINGLPLNENASMLVGYTDLIMGDVLVCDSNQIK